MCLVQGCTSHPYVSSLRVELCRIATEVAGVQNPSPAPPPVSNNKASLQAHTRLVLRLSVHVPASAPWHPMAFLVTVPKDQCVSPAVTLPYGKGFSTSAPSTQPCSLGILTQ